MPTAATSPCSHGGRSGAGTSSKSTRSGWASRSGRARPICTTSAAGKEGLVAAVEAGAAVLAVCGGYQLLGRFYRERSGAELPGVGLFPLQTLAGERRMIGDVLLDCELAPGRRRTLAGFENHAGRTILDDGAEP